MCRHKASPWNYQGVCLKTTQGNSLNSQCPGQSQSHANSYMMFQESQAEATVWGNRHVQSPATALAFSYTLIFNSHLIDPQPAVKMPRQKLHHMPWEQRGDSRTLLLDEFLHVQTYLYITYSLYLWQGWMALFYPTPGIFQELQTDSGRWGQAGMCSWKEVGKQLRGQTGLPIASHSGRTLPATLPGAGE